MAVPGRAPPAPALCQGHAMLAVKVGFPVQPARVPMETLLCRILWKLLLRRGHRFPHPLCSSVSRDGFRWQVPRGTGAEAGLGVTPPEGQTGPVKAEGPEVSKGFRCPEALKRVAGHDLGGEMVGRGYGKVRSETRCRQGEAAPEAWPSGRLGLLLAVLGPGSTLRTAAIRP